MTSFAKHVKPLVLALALLVPLPLLAQSTEELLQAVQQRYLATSSFTAHFAQRDRRTGSAPREAEGLLKYKRGMMRWQYEAPEEQLIVTNGDTLWLYDPLLENVTIQPLNNVATGTALAFLLGLGDLGQDFQVQEVSQTLFTQERGMVLELKPREPLANLELMQLEVNPDTLELQALALADAQGNVREIRLSEVAREVELADEEFQFDVTPDMEVIQTE